MATYHPDQLSGHRVAEQLEDQGGVRIDVRQLWKFVAAGIPIAGVLGTIAGIYMYLHPHESEKICENGIAGCWVEAADKIVFTGPDGEIFTATGGSALEIVGTDVDTQNNEVDYWVSLPVDGNTSLRRLVEEEELAPLR